MDPRPPPERLSDQLLRERRQRERSMVRPVLEILLILAIPTLLVSGVYWLVLEFGGPRGARDLLIPIGALSTLAFGRKRLARIEREARPSRRGYPRYRGDTRDQP